jgi:16S rRNA (cytidine1402-2'-O)-methyltransferase
VLYETGPRLAGALADLAAGLGGREAAICRELTKLHEDVHRGDLAMLAQGLATAEVRGEIAIVIAPPPGEERPSAEEADRLLRDALARASLKDAVAEVSAATGLPRRDVYQRALALARQTANNPTRHGAPR